MNRGEVEERVAEMGTGGSVIPGSGVHVASVVAPMGETDFSSFRSAGRPIHRFQGSPGNLDYPTSSRGLIVTTTTAGGGDTVPERDDQWPVINLRPQWRRAR